MCSHELRSSTSQSDTLSLLTKNVGFGGFDPNQFLISMGWIFTKSNGIPTNICLNILSGGNS
eukprot:16434815-Heterocapsa_arctica.AAC.1